MQFYPWAPVAFDPWGGAGLAYGPHGGRQSRAAPAWGLLVPSSAHHQYQQAPRQRRRSAAPYGQSNWAHEDEWDDDDWEVDDLDALQMLYDEPDLYGAYEQQRGPRRHPKEQGMAPAGQMGVSLVPQYADAAEGSPRNRCAGRKAAAADAYHQQLLQQQQQQNQARQERQLQQQLLEQQQQQLARQQALLARQQQQLRKKQQPPMRPVQQQQVPLPLRPEPLTAPTAAKPPAASPAGPAAHVPLTPSPRQQQGVKRRVPVAAACAAAPQPAAAAQAAPAQQAPAAASAVPPAPAGRPRAQGGPQRRGMAMTKSQAARVIQTQWRMARLARHRDVLRKLATANNALRDLEQMLSTRMAAFNGHLSHKDFLELSEYTTRVLLQLDELSVRPPELRALKKHLTQRALALLDAVQNAYSRAVHASMQLSDEEVAQALARGASIGAARAGGPAAAGTPGTAVAEAASQETQQQQLGQAQQEAMPPDVCDMEEEAEEDEWLEQHGDTAAEEAYRSTVQATQDDLCSASAGGSMESSSTEAEPAVAEGAAPTANWGGPFAKQASAEDLGWGRMVEAEEEMAPSRDIWEEESLPAPDAAATDAADACGAGVHGAHDVPPGVRLVWVYPGSRAEAACQTE